VKDWTIGIIGGSGLYEIESLEARRTLDIVTPWGAPSDSLLEGVIADTRVVFLPRHGRGHRLGPSDLNYQANIAALKMAGCTDILSISAVGSLRADLPPRTFVLVDQFIDRTVARASSFFEPGLVAHVSLADPICARLAALAAAAARRAGAQVVEGGTYLAMEGPQFSTRAESRLYQSWGCAVIGMTNMPEARLAREAQLPYATIATVTDYDCWHEAERPVQAEQIVRCMQDNVREARLMIEHFISALPARREASPIDSALQSAILTAPEARDPVVVAKLRAAAIL
jgi:5'-methylthioadenosine phosphorylase